MAAQLVSDTTSRAGLRRIHLTAADWPEGGLDAAALAVGVTVPVDADAGWVEFIDDQGWHGWLWGRA